MTPQELETIHADIMVAKTILYNDTGISNNPYMTNQAAYHSAQAIEKSLKAIIRDGGKMNSILSTTHNIDALLLRAEMCRAGIIHDYPLVAENSDTLSRFNSLRYCGKGIGKYDAISIFKEAKTLYQDLKQEYLKKNPNKELFNENSLKEYDSLEKLKINKPYEPSYD